jgi:SAM-dependent methyltransferase
VSRTNGIVDLLGLLTVTECHRNPTSFCQESGSSRRQPIAPRIPHLQELFLARNLCRPWRPHLRRCRTAPRRAVAEFRLPHMHRVLEPELMTDDRQARAYAEANFEDANRRFIELFARTFSADEVGSWVLDLGCGPADIAIRFARLYPRCTVHGVDGSEAMLRYARTLLDGATDVRNRIELVLGRIPEAGLPRRSYDTVISNSLLHHLPDPGVLWQTAKDHATPGAPVLIMDLVRPESVSRAREIVEAYAGAEPAVLKKDFYNSLRAAFEPEEIRAQLAAAGLTTFAVERASDRHVIVWGRMPADPRR